MPLSDNDARDVPSSSEVFDKVWLDRDLAWLEYNRRVLHRALDESTPLLERVKFLAIVGSNLDEFFMKRIGVLRGKAGIDGTGHGQRTLPQDARQGRTNLPARRPG